MKLYLLRHGQTDWNVAHKLQGRTDIPLNKKGIGQAQTEAKRVKAAGITFDRVISSPLSRAKQTASIVSGLPEEQIETDARIAEMSFGVDEGKFYSFDPALRDKMEENYRNFAYHPQRYKACQGGESYQQLIERTASFYRDLIARYGDSGESILVVSHGAALHGMLYTMFARENMEEFWDPHIANCRLMRAVKIGDAVVLTEDDLCSVLKQGAGGGDLYIFNREKGKKPDRDKPVRYVGLVSGSVDAGLRPDTDFTIGGDMGKNRILLIAEAEAEASRKIVVNGAEKLITGNAEVAEDGKGGYDAYLPAPSGKKAVLSLITYPDMRVIARGFAPVNPAADISVLPDEEGEKRAEILVSDIPDGMGEIWLDFWCTCGSGTISDAESGRSLIIPAGRAEEVKLRLSDLGKELLRQDSCRLVLSLKADGAVSKAKLPKEVKLLCVRKVHVI
ncbi:MAG: histidine phosphatase family protein [Lachnospiraceae bacterium]|jgi:broad specificity phosphatase PhoE